jgi:hypothetical protein
VIDAVGIGYDDSVQGELPHRSSQDIAHWIGAKA